MRIIGNRRWWIAAGVIGVAGVVGYALWPRVLNAFLPPGSRPGRIPFAVERVTPEEFGRIADRLREALPPSYRHADRFREAKIFAYEGPRTCLKCHSTLKVKDPRSGKTRRVGLLADVLGSVHYRFFSDRHPNVWGFNGKRADPYPMGKVDRPCPKPGSFAFTAWAEVVRAKDGRAYSDGCGQCHIGGEYQPPLGELLPGYRPLAVEGEAIDCLICHAALYDMNRKVVVTDPDGRRRWGQDRSMMAALSVGKTTAQTCLRCHQHNLGGDLYVDRKDPSFMEWTRNLGTDRPRIRHPGSKRGTPYSPSWDVHAAAGMACTDCHRTEGHRIAKGTHTTTMMANDLPDTEVACESCHGTTPHPGDTRRGKLLNAHFVRIACQTCHIPSLHPDNVTLRDFSRPIYEEDTGLYLYRDLSHRTEPGRGITYVWWNGDATFLGNAVGANPKGRPYRFYAPANPWPEFRGFDYDGWYESTMVPIARAGRPSKIYPMKVFNGRQHVDLGNMGPFGGMYVPYNFPIYYETGDADRAAQVEAAKPMFRMLYGPLFKFYLMNRFMQFMNVPRWNMKAYRDVVSLARVEARWLPENASMEVNHAVRATDALRCEQCHAPKGILDWDALGYTDEEVRGFRRRRFR